MIKKFFYVVATILLLSIGYLCFEYFDFIAQRNARIISKGSDTTIALRDDINTILTTITKEGNRLSQLFGSKNLTAKEVEQIIKESALKIPEIQGVTACFEPYAFSDKKRLYCPYYNKGDKRILRIENSYDYSDATLEGTAWYTSVRDNGAKWVEPYFAKGAQDWYIDYGLPFYYQNGPHKGKVKGTITLSFVCSGFKNLIHAMSIGKTGYGMITSEKGTFLAHPINEYIGTKSIDSVIDDETNTNLKMAYNTMKKGASGNIAFTNSSSLEEAIFYFDTIPSSNWRLGLVFFKKDLLGNSSSLNKRYIRLALTFSLFVICLLVIYYNKDYLSPREIWNLSIVTSFLLVCNIFLVGYLQHHNNSPNQDSKSPPVTDMATLGNFIQQQHLKASHLKTQQLTPIPTGIYIKRMEFEDSYNLNLGGTIWQKYPSNIVDSVAVGFTFPQLSPFAEASYIEESYRKKLTPKEGEPTYTLVSWDFRVTLSLNLSYLDFPFDKRHLNIEITPLKTNDHLIFTPDLESYNYTNPSKKSGLNPKIIISGSEVTESYFNYSLETYDADFGHGIKGLFEEVPVLHFNIHLRRMLLNAFVTYLIPIFVILLMVYILLFACEKTSERQGIIESMAAFFFVLIFSHIDLRKEVVTADLIYIEYYYFIVYIMLILSTYNMIIYSKNKSAIFDFNENQIFKAIYFPIFFLLVLIVSLIKFY